MSRRSRGYARLVDRFDGKTLAEADAVTCSHCNGIVHTHDKQGRAKNGVLVHCHQCDAATCVPCAETGRCTPFEKKLEAIESSARLRAAIGAP